MDDRTHGPRWNGPVDGSTGDHDPLRLPDLGRQGVGRNNFDHANLSQPDRDAELEREFQAITQSSVDFDALARSIRGEEHSVRVWPILMSGIIIALIVLSFIYRWAPWLTIGLVALLGVVVAAAYFQRPPAAPVELTAGERDRVTRVLEEHGTRTAVALVRALYPTEPNAAAMRAVQQLAARMKATQHSAEPYDDSQNGDSQK